MTVPEGVKEDQINAKYENGVLQVTFPKPPGTTQKQTKKINIA
jgi:HSP20 family molecular chaperone IbpA